MDISPYDSSELLERTWHAREEGVFQRLFGDLGPGIYTLQPATFEPFGAKETDPRWLHCGVFESPPSRGRTSWIYVSSGLSNPWWNSATRRPGYSGLGCEFLLELTARAPWGIAHVQNIVAFQLLLTSGHYPDRAPLDSWDRVPLRQPIDAHSSELSYLLVAPPDDPSRTFHLESGRVVVYTLVGVTEVEAGFARDQGGERLLEKLKARGAYPVTDPQRHSVISAA